MADTQRPAPAPGPAPRSEAVRKLIAQHRSPVREGELTAAVQEVVIDSPGFKEVCDKLIRRCIETGYEANDVLAKVNTHLTADDIQFGTLYTYESPEQMAAADFERLEHIPKDIRAYATGMLLYEQYAAHLATAAHGMLPKLAGVPAGGLTDERKKYLARGFSYEFMKADYYPEHDQTAYLHEQRDAPRVAASEWFADTCRRELDSSDAQLARRIIGDTVTLFPQAREAFLAYCSEKKAARGQGQGGGIA